MSSVSRGDAAESEKKGRLKTIKATRRFMGSKMTNRVRAASVESRFTVAKPKTSGVLAAWPKQKPPARKLARP